MPFGIQTPHDERLFVEYTRLRTAARDAMAHGVYPSLTRAIQAYDALDAALATTLADPDLLAYHVSVMTAIAPSIAQLRAGAEQIVATMTAIEEAAPGTFGIPLATFPEEV